ncbi:hypothetical protein BDM02DRAFT_1364424 [Thelephora ganbajun]|uniref:Uncharacterized protein n=1 Tax=Thelephora ganbajun TaxID=370292 RepID=A0ACB6Z1X4_THEGA|nr:hypothetical protein BDM02DRAFT_1364424 [Thelephora ganbajun]
MPTTMIVSPTTGDVGRSRGPVPSVSSMVVPLVQKDGSDLCAVRAIGLNLSNRIAMIVWHRGKAKTSRPLSGASPEMCTTCESSCRLPYEIVEIIIAHLTYDLDTMKACSLVCRSWYAATAPQVHHTLVLRDKMFGTARGGLKPLSKLHKLGLLHLVKEIQVEQWPMSGWFVPQGFSSADLRYFSAFANVQSLRLENVAIYRFIPGIERYFEQFSPTLRSIALFYPICSTPRQLSHFLSLFPNLDDIEIRWFSTCNTSTPNVELVPFSAPKLQGRLTLYDFRWVETWTYLIAACGGLRFHYMDLRKVAGCAPILLKACAETLETLRFYVTDGLG